MEKHLSSQGGARGENKNLSLLRFLLSLLRRQKWAHTVFATRTKNEQCASSNSVNFIDPIPAYAGMTKHTFAGMTKYAYARRDKKEAGMTVRVI